MAKLYRTILPVDDIERAATFYAQLLGAAGERVSPGRHYFDCEGMILACYDPAADGDDEAPRPIPGPLYFAVDAIEETYRLCREAGARFSTEVAPGIGAFGEIAARPWGETSFYVSDPFGNPLCFVARETAFRGGATDPE